MGTRSGHAVAAILGGVVLCVVGIRAAETITDAIGSSFQVCTVQVLTSEERIRDDNRTSSARITKALAAANAATEDKIGALILGPTPTSGARAVGGASARCRDGMASDEPRPARRGRKALGVRRPAHQTEPKGRDWGPVSPTTGRPLKSRKGEYFRAWVQALENIGYRFDCRVINCADFGDATTRERLFMMAWQSRKPLPWPEPTHSRTGGDLFGSSPWRTARDVIDWTIPGTSIFNRKRPLAPKTLARIAAGIVKFRWPAPFLVVLRQHCDARGIDLPLPTVTAGGTHLGLVQPFVLSQASGGSPREVAEPVPTIPTGGAHALIAPYYGSGSGETCRSVDTPLPTATAKARFGLVMPVTHAGAGNRSRSVDAPLPTITTARRGELAFITAAFGERPTQAPRVHSVDEPTPTICATGRTPLVTAGLEYDIRFRMLEPHELAAAMSISEPDRPYRFTGTKTQVVRQIGQAVPRRTGRALARALMEAIP
jgi:DNA (cytosine-5)-methyltransferase 1